MAEDVVDRSVTLAAPRERVWRALTDYREFGAWFRVALDGPFEVGAPVTGHITYEGYEHLRFTARVMAIESMHRFAFSWHPYAIDPSRDYSGEPETLVEFTLGDGPGGTLLRVRESGFEKLPEARRREAFPRNDEGWAIQLGNIAAHLADAG